MKKNKTLYLLIFSALIFAGCTSVSYLVNVIEDEIPGVTIYRMRNNLLGSDDRFLATGNAYLNLQKNAKDTDVSYYMILEYYSEKWLHIREGESLVLTIDGETVGYRGEGSKNHRDFTSQGAFVEKAFYSIESSDIERIASAKSIAMKIIGDDAFIYRHFTASNSKNFKLFYCEHVDKTAKFCE